MELSERNSISVPVWTPTGKVGGAYEFDGIDDWMDTDTSPSELGLTGSAPKPFAHGLMQGNSIMEAF